MRHDNVIVRKVDALDSLRIEMAIATLRETYRPTIKALEHKQATSATLTRLVALRNDHVIGTVQYFIRDDRVHLLSLGVHADCRRRASARRFTEELEAIGRTAGATRLSTYVVTQTGNCEIFKRLGFHLLSEEPTDFFESDRHIELTESYLERAIA